MTEDQRDQDVGDLARRVYALRKARGMTMRELAQAAGVSATHIYQLEHGKRRNMQLPTLLRLARALGTSPAELDTRDAELMPSDEIEDVRQSLRGHTSLTERAIEQVMRFVQALELEQSMPDILDKSEQTEEGGSGQDVGYKSETG